MSILTIIFTKATKTITKNYYFILLGSSPSSCRKSEIIYALDLAAYTTSFGPLTTSSKPRYYGENFSGPGYVEGSLTSPSYRGKSQLLLRISLQNVTNCCMRNKTLARLFRWPGLVTRLAWPTFLHANTLTRPGSGRSTGPTPDNHSEHALALYQLLANKTADIWRRHW